MSARVVVGPHHSHSPPIGILAGNGHLPAEIARSVADRGGTVVIVGIDGEVAGDIAGVPVTRVGWGQVGHILGTFRNAGCRQIVIVGGVTRPDVATLRPDMGALTNLPSLIRVLLSGGDDGVLRGVVRFFEAKGFQVLSPGEAAPHLVVSAGVLGAIEPSARDAADMLLGSSIVRALGAFDIGQGVIVCDGHIEAIEAAEGTDRMIARVALRRQRERAQSGCEASPTRGVLVKRPKPQQEMRVDLPTIGPNTIERAVEARLAGLAVLAGQTLVAERSVLIEQADANGIFVHGFVDSDPARGRVREAIGGAEVVVLGKRQPSLRAVDDAKLGMAVLGALDVLTREGVVVVNRGYVLGVETEARATEILARTAGLKQWGSGRWLRRSGVAVLGCDLTADLALIERASHLKALAVTGATRGRLDPDVVAAADATGLVLLTVGSAP
jgi:UDP-2,3-diacylglucosamine hydrolase